VTKGYLELVIVRPVPQGAYSRATSTAPMSAFPRGSGVRDGGLARDNDLDDDN